MSGENTAGVVVWCADSAGPRDHNTHCIQLSLLVQTAETENIYVPNLCFSISTCISLLPFEVPKPQSQYPPFVFFFNWGVVALQCCASLFCIMK